MQRIPILGIFKNADMTPGIAFLSTIVGLSITGFMYHVIVHYPVYIIEPYIVEEENTEILWI